MRKFAFTLIVGTVGAAMGAALTGAAIYSGVDIGGSKSQSTGGSLLDLLEGDTKSQSLDPQPSNDLVERNSPQPADPPQVKVLKINTNIRGGLGSAFCNWDSSEELQQLQNDGWSISGETPLQYTSRSLSGRVAFCEGKSVTLSK